MAQVLRRSDACELTKIADEVRLIEIAGRDRQVRPIGIPFRVDALQDAFEPGEPRKCLRRQTHFAAKHLDEALGAEAKLIPDAGDRRGHRTLKFSNRMMNRGIAWPACTQSLHEKGLEHEKSVAVRRRLEEMVA